MVDCGMKYNQIRCFLKRGVRVKIVPYDHDFVAEQYDGLFLTNGPGDPTMCSITIENLRRVLAKRPAKPVQRCGSGMVFFFFFFLNLHFNDIGGRFRSLAFVWVINYLHWLLVQVHTSFATAIEDITNHASSSNRCDATLRLRTTAMQSIRTLFQATGSFSLRMQTTRQTKVRLRTNGRKERKHDPLYLYRHSTQITSIF